MKRRAPAGLAVALWLGACGGSGAPELAITDPVSGETVAVACVTVSADDCEAAAAAMLDYLPADAARVEGMTVEPMADPPADAELAVQVTVDHEMFLQAGEQPYTVVRRAGSAEVEIDLVRE